MNQGGYTSYFYFSSILLTGPLCPQANQGGKDGDKD